MTARHLNGDRRGTAASEKREETLAAFGRGQERNDPVVRDLID
jgi:hypothetical protein